MIRKLTTKHPGGRPRKFETIEKLQRKIDRYFKSCWAQKMDVLGNPMFIRDKSGKQTKKKVLIQIKPYTVTGLAVFLDVDRDTLLNYEAKSEFFGTIKRAKQRCETYAEESLFIGKNVSGAIFNLKNNYGWKDRAETEHSGSVVWMEEPPK